MAKSGRQGKKGENTHLEQKFYVEKNRWIADTVFTKLHTPNCIRNLPVFFDF
jgi:hypothetical protein